MSIASKHPDALRDEEKQLVTWAGDGGTVGGTELGSKRQPWKFTEIANATAVVEDEPQRGLYSSMKTCSSRGEWPAKQSKRWETSLHLGHIWHTKVLQVRPKQY